MPMLIDECFSVLASRWTDELVVTSAGNSSEVWWEVTHDTERTFYLEASMSLSTMFASGIAIGYPDARFWAFIGDGAFVMNTGLLFVERDLALSNLVSIIVANRCYGATDGIALPNSREIDFAAVARAAGISRVFSFDSIASLNAGFEEAFRSAGPTTVVLDLAPPARHYESPPFDGPELKYRFGRALERRFSRIVLP
ncbi:MAG TPA: thiamine pyrophosphate-dependent enzyme [Pseudolabrys sp.]|nr:thiamine pyrophosphate-dependent enzyme [Pseudolabrys sp.]